jgi:transposase InsO family protein
MTITMNDSNLNTINDLKAFIDAAKNSITFKRQNQSESYQWVQNTLIKFEYMALNKFEKGIIKQYIRLMSQYSRAQITRFIKMYHDLGEVYIQNYERNTFIKKYSDDEIKLLAQMDEIHGFPNAFAIKSRLHILAQKDPRYKTLADISISYIYKIRKSVRYQRMTKRYDKTKPTRSGIGIGRRAKPEPNGNPGYIRVDTVHQGDRNGAKGVYHINTISQITQYECVGAVPEITHEFMVPILRKIIEVYPFKILGFHCDNGSEYINKFIVTLLNELLIDLTKSRPRHSNDNGLIETKNGSIIRTWIGYGFIDKQFAKDLNDFYFGCFNEYLNFHRPCGFASIKELPNGKIKKVYKFEDYATPYDKLKSLPNAKQYLKKGLSFKKLDHQFLARNCNEHGEIVQRERQKLFNKIFALNNSPSGSLFN